MRNGQQSMLWRARRRVQSGFCRGTEDRSSCETILLPLGRRCDEALRNHPNRPKCCVADCRNSAVNLSSCPDDRSTLHRGCCLRCLQPNLALSIRARRSPLHHRPADSIIGPCLGLLCELRLGAVYGRAAELLSSDFHSLAARELYSQRTLSLGMASAQRREAPGSGRITGAADVETAARPDCCVTRRDFVCVASGANRVRGVGDRTRSADVDWCAGCADILSSIHRCNVCEGEPQRTKVSQGSGG